MNGTKKYTGRSLSMPAGLAVGLGVSMAITGGVVGILAKLVDSEMMPWENVGYGIMAMLLAASFLGAVAAYGKIKRQRLMVCLLSGGIFFCALLSLTALFFGGQYNGVTATFLFVLMGSASAGLLGLRQGREDRRKRKHYMKN